MFRFYSKGGGPRATLIGVHSDGVLKISSSRSSVEDSFCRAKGIELAQARMARGKHVCEIPMETCYARTFVNIATVVSDVVLRTKATTKK